MAMSRRKDRARTPGLWIATNALPVTGGHPFYQRLNQVLDTHAFDAFVEAQCAPFYAATVGRPSLLPGTYFRLLLIGYFEGIDSERGIAWRTADSLALRGFLGLGLDEATPEHSTISRTRRLIDLETHRAVFTWILQVLATADLVKGKTIGIDATTLEANAALRSIVRRDSGETYQEFLTRLAQASGIETPTRALYVVDDSQAVNGPAYNFRMIMLPSEAALMHSRANGSANSNERIGGTAVWKERHSYYDVGIRLRGSMGGRYGSGHSIKFQPDHLFRGIHSTVSTDRNTRTGLGLKEIILLRAFTRAGGLPGMYNDIVQAIGPEPAYTGPAMLRMAGQGDVFLDSQPLCYPRDVSDGAVEAYRARTE